MSRALEQLLCLLPLDRSSPYPGEWQQEEEEKKKTMISSQHQLDGSLGAILPFQ
jgi:hypothetical protein